MRYLLIILVLLVRVSSCSAQQDSIKQDSAQLKQAPAKLQELFSDIVSEEKKKVSSDADIEIDGLLFDETKTKSGRDFYDYFYSAWQAPANARNYSIYITEKPFRLTTTMIEIRLNETLVFQSFLQPRNDLLEMTAQQAVARTHLFLQHYEELKKQMEGADQSGTGIF